MNVKKTLALASILMIFSLSVGLPIQATESTEQCYNMPKVKIVNKETLLKEVEMLCTRFEAEVKAASLKIGMPVADKDGLGLAKMFLNLFIPVIDRIAARDLDCLTVIEEFRYVVDFEQTPLFRIEDIRKELSFEKWICASLMLKVLCFMLVTDLIFQITTEAVQNNINSVNFVRDEKKIYLKFTRDIIGAYGDAHIIEAVDKKYDEDLMRLIELHFNSKN
jgi:hypothetical protein